MSKYDKDFVVYNKLVRDKIPDIIEKAGKVPAFRKLAPEELTRYLKLKLLEEAGELQSCTNDELCNEIADVLEVLYSIAENQSIDWAMVDSTLKSKRLKRGGFKKGIFLESVSASGIAHNSLIPETYTHPRFCSTQRFGSYIDNADSAKSIELIELISNQLEDTDELCIASAFITRGAVNLLNGPLARFTKRGGKIRILTSIMNNFNDPATFRFLMERFPDAELRVFVAGDKEQVFSTRPSDTSFHAKCFLFRKDSGNNGLLIGSSNLTTNALINNVEWNYFSSFEVNLAFTPQGSPFNQALNEFNNCWQYCSIDCTPDFLAKYKQRYDQQHSKAQQLQVDRTLEEITPRTAQIEALKSLKLKRLAGVDKTAVIAATGLGKTYLSAFDFRQAQNDSGYSNILFVVHRDQILEAAQIAFGNVLGLPSFGVRLSGTSEKSAGDIAAKSGQSVFATVQTLSRKTNLKKFPADYFDYIVIDEFHHSAADSYQRVLDHFSPRFLLGMTATPERMDGRDVLRFCEHNVAYESRLFDAIDRGWLVPFQYYAIKDSVDYRQIRWTGRNFDEVQLNDALCNDTRTALVLENFRRFLPSHGLKSKAIAFCSSVIHARYMTEQFCNAGVSCEYVTGETSSPERTALISRLVDEDDPLEVICSIDVFSEGIDIPQLTHILLLRPTQSETVFLQQLGRGLRTWEDKEFLVVLDFVGNYCERNNFIPPIISGGRNIESVAGTLPSCCHVDVSIEVEQIWARTLNKKMPHRQILTNNYADVRENVGHSPGIMDFFVNPLAEQPKEYIKEFNGWLQTKKHMDDLTTYEQALIDTDGENFLLHLERELRPSKSYKMVVLQSILAESKTNWSIEELALQFKSFYLKNREHMEDYNALWKFADKNDPEEFSTSKVIAHLKTMPLKYLSNSDDKHFILDAKSGMFYLKDKFVDYWQDDDYRGLVADRTQFALADYFYRKSQKGSAALLPSA